MRQKKKVSAEVTIDIWKQLKILALQKEVSLQFVIEEILEKSMRKRVASNGGAEMSPDIL